MLIKIFNLLVMLFVPFLFAGIINKTKAFWGGRKGAPVMQPFYDYLRLLRKNQVISTTTSYIFHISPIVTYAAIILAGLHIPVLDHQAILPMKMDFVIFAYILALGKFFQVIGAIDTGSSFEGMGASREVTFSSIAEPAFFIIIACLATISGYTSFENILNPYINDSMGYLIIMLSAVTLFIILILEGCRVPIDDPNTHLELTMIHEVMVLDNSGPDLAFISHGSAIKMTLFGILIANLIIPSHVGILLSLSGILIILAILAIIIGTIESFYARLRMTHVPQFILIAISIALFAMSSTLLYIYGGIK